MANVYITVQYDNDQQKDLAVPLDVPSRVLATALSRALDQEGTFEETFTLIEERPEGMRRIPANASLGEAEVYNGSILKLISEQRAESRAVPQGKTCLMTIEGREIALNGAYTLIGRKDVKHGILPDLDLTEMDSMKIASRRHACIEFDQTTYKLTDLGSSNGTWLNGERLELQQARPLQDGDFIAFGRNGVKVKFKKG